MACNCGKKAGPVQYVFTPLVGAPQTFRTEVEAKAAKIRAGGGTVTRT